ncbi:RadC family protein [Gallaecimonas pentaromativorans]|uniref:DNA repair protein RadC n=1 Tax=Gallaecimonas pentaromativorans TaxID=584787 RepID=A0A3N1NQD7_9GAMM|nr:DNA repair protein RadC [Gallaecimonas pentaromativorans]MED5526136.1 DNA repair protein RadC [Pseudomonadota bacterium]ROQ21984.1 DNA repair protein RadC [Gallaecimonas pentaromativorans]
MAIRDWPEAERPREKLLSKGAGALSDAELLAIFLRVGVAGKDAVTLARELLGHFGSLRSLINADAGLFCQAPGMGPAKFAQLQAAVELSRRFLGEKLSREAVLSCPDDVRRYLISRLRDQPREVFCLLLLDAQHRVIKLHELFFGTLDGAAVYPREVVKAVLAANAAAVILVHNHPSGIAEPSRADRQLTERLGAALGLVEVRVLDHLVIGDGEAISFAERGWL